MKPAFVHANIIASPSDAHAGVIDSTGHLRAYHGGRRKPQPGIRPSIQKRHLLYGLGIYAAAKVLPPYLAESSRFALCDSFEKRVLRDLQPGDNLIGGLGYLNRCIERVQGWGGISLLDARNSHPSSFWTIVAEEYGRWDVKRPPILPYHHARQQRSAAISDYFFVPSNFVRDSFIKHGFPPEKLLLLPYPVDLDLFHPPANPRPKDRPLTMISSGGLDLRKGAPYLFEAFQIVRKEVPNARLKLIHNIAPSVESIMKRKGYDKLPIDWAPYMHGRPALISWLQEADIFVLPTLEEGMVRSAAEAMSCGLPVVTTANSGINDHITEGENGSIVPLRDPQATAAAVLVWWEKIQSGDHDPTTAKMNREALSHKNFTKTLLTHLQNIRFPLTPDP